MKMDNDLLKHLKDAGFPQREDNQQGYGTTIVVPDEFGGHHEKVYIPTLEELVDACGANFKKLTFIPEKAVWYADSYPSGSWTGVTHTEAVGKLWLSLE